MGFLGQLMQWKYFQHFLRRESFLLGTSVSTVLYFLFYPNIMLPLHAGSHQQDSLCNDKDSIPCSLPPTRMTNCVYWNASGRGQRCCCWKFSITSLRGKSLPLAAGCALSSLQTLTVVDGAVKVAAEKALEYILARSRHKNEKCSKSDGGTNNSQDSQSSTSEA